MEQIKHVISTMPIDTEIERRNRALVAFTLLTGARDSAIASITTAGLPYFNPHSFRNTLVQLGQDVCKTPEQFKAWSQNLGHEKVLTTFLSYGEVACHRQGEIIRDLATPQKNMPTDANEIAEAVFKRLSKAGVDY